jgi:hypothetical protein
MSCALGDRWGSVLFLLVAANAAASEKAPADLRACKLDADCVLVAGPCGTPVAVNKKYKDLAEPRPDLIPVIFCVHGFVPGEWQRGAIPVCRKAECDVRLPKHRPTD